MSEIARPAASEGSALSPPASPPSPAAPDFDALYDAHFDFVWRSVRRLGVLDASVDDAAQEVFVVVHRRLADFEGRSSVRTWLYGIVRKVVADHRRARQRRAPHEVSGLDAARLEAAVGGPGPTPEEALGRAQGLELLHALLDALPDDRREVFVLAELEQLSAAEIGELTGASPNTVSSRLRLARRDFDAALTRHRARHARRVP